MPSFIAPSSVPETYRPLSALSGSFDMDAASVEHVRRSHHGHINDQFRPKYFSETDMYVCCNCGDGPKVYSHNPVCVQCHHHACSACAHIK
ncbi:hypothetical protein BDW74DRAFT_154047 [Aspergillus multicolor]|uniref:uncharacterized protein n=1 Tax=Aspergillus multicolor TaxID=41759 RepID=UPI003CCCFC4A